MWDLVSAFGRIMRQSAAARPSSIVYDDTPDPRLHEPHPRPAVRTQGRLAFSALVPAGHAQVDPGGHLPGGVGAGAPPSRVRRAERGFRRDLAAPDRVSEPLDFSASTTTITPGGNNPAWSTIFRFKPWSQGHHHRGLFAGGGADLLADPRVEVGFDLGAQPWSFMGTPTWFVSHAHIDHLVALPVYVARRRMMKMEPPTIYLPEDMIEPMERILKLFSRLDRGRLPCTLVPCGPGTKSNFRESWWSPFPPPGTRCPRWALWFGSGGGS